MRNEINSTPKLTLSVFLVSCLALPCASLLFPAHAADLSNSTTPTHTQEVNSSIQFQLQKGSLESNVKRLLSQHSDTRLLLWEVSKQHQVIIDSTVTANSIYELVDKIISPYRSPAQIKADFYTENGVARFYYLPNNSSYQGQFSP